MKTSNIDNLGGFSGAKQIVSDFYTLVDAQNDGTRRRRIPFSLRQNQTEMLDKLQDYWTDMAGRLLAPVNTELLLPVVQTDAQYIESAVHSFETQAIGAVAPLGTLNLVEWRSQVSKTAMNQYGLATKWDAERLGDPDGLNEYMMAMQQILKSIRLFLQYDGFESVQDAGMPHFTELMDQPDMGWYDQVMRLRDYFGQGNISDTEMHAGFTQMQSDLEHRCDFKPTVIFVPRSVRPLFGVRSSLVTRHSEGGDPAVARFLNGILLDKIGDINVVEAPTVGLTSDGTGAESMLRNYAQSGTYYFTNYASRFSESGNKPAGMTEAQMARRLSVRVASYDLRSMEEVTYENMLKSDPIFTNGENPGNHVLKNPTYGTGVASGTRKLKTNDEAWKAVFGAGAALPTVAGVTAGNEVSADSILKLAMAGYRPLLDYVLFKPYTGIHTQNAVIAHGGKELGITAIGQINYFLSQDNQAATASNSARVKMCTHISNPMATMTIPHYFYDKILPNRNGSNKFFTLEKHEQFIQAGGGQTNDSLGTYGLIACSFGSNEEVEPVGVLMDVVGYTGHGDDTGTTSVHYPSASFYNNTWFSDHKSLPSIPLVDHMNRMCLPGAIEFSSDGVSWDIRIEGQGFDYAEGKPNGFKTRHLGASFLE
jgi:hypothetical protein